RDAEVGSANTTATKATARQAKAIVAILAHNRRSVRRRSNRAALMIRPARAIRQAPNTRTKRSSCTGPMARTTATTTTRLKVTTSQLRRSHCHLSPDTASSTTVSLTSTAPLSQLTTEPTVANGSLNRVRKTAGTEAKAASSTGSANRFSQRSARPTSLDASSAERSEEHTSELQSRENLVCRLLLEKKK